MLSQCTVKLLKSTNVGMGLFIVFALKCIRCMLHRLIYVTNGMASSIALMYFILFEQSDLDIHFLFLAVALIEK